MFKENSNSGSFSSTSTSSLNTTNNKGCLSKLTKEFIKKAEYAQITKDEALNACSLVLTAQKGQEEYLYNSLLENQILVPSSKSIYLLNDVSTQCVLVKLTSCYSPLCTTSSCYSPCCPNRAITSLHLVNDPSITSTATSQQPDYMNSRIPRVILESLSPQEKKRQLAIEELQNYEENFLKQLIVIRDKFAKPLLLSSTTIEESRRITFHDTLFGNYNVLANHHKRILKELESTRDTTNHNLFPDSILIGDILYKNFKRLIDPYIRYVSNHVFAEYLYKSECHRNIAFTQFIEQQESIEKDFRLTLKGLLLSPIVRIAKYDLLFTTIIKSSPEDQRLSLYQCNTLLSDILYKINEATRKAEQEQRLLEIKHGLRLRRSLTTTTSTTTRSQHRISQILPDDVHLIYEGTLELMNRIPPTTCQVFLFSNALLITREKSNTTDSSSEFTLLDKAIPLHMLKLGSTQRTSGSLLSNSSSSQPTLLSSIRHQLSSGSYHYYQRRWNSERITSTSLPSDTTTISSTRSDDGSSIYSGVYTISGLKLRHRIKSIKKRIKTRKTASISYTSTSKGITSPTSSSLLQQQKPTSPPPRVMRPRILHIQHLADPTQLTYLFECPSTDERLIWKNKIKSVLPNPDHGPFGLETLVRNSNYSTLRNVNGRYAIGCGTIWCSLPFTTSEGRDVIALGTRLGVWVAYTDGSEIFRHILPYNCHQLELFDNRILLARCSKPHRGVLGAISIDRIYPPSGTSSSNNTNNDMTKDFQPLQKSGVISFAVGTLRGESILCYLRRRRTGSIRLVLMSYRSADSNSNHSSSPSSSTPPPWFRKYKEYKPITIQPTDLTIIQDAVYIRSCTEGIEKVDIINWIMGTQNSNTFQHVKYSYRISLPTNNYFHPISMVVANNPQTDDPSLATIGYVPLKEAETGLICSGKVAWPVVEANNADLLQQEIIFETEAKNVVVCYPYLLVFSSNVIEVRHLETTALVQAIGGNKIRCVYVSRPLSSTAPPMIHITMLHADEDLTKVYQLYLKEPIAIDE